jgi:hypothetical protein
MDREQEQDLPSRAPEEQLAAMGLAPRAGTGTPAGPGGQAGDLPNLPPEQQRAAMGVASEAEAEAAAEPPSAREGPSEPEVEAYEAAQAEAGPPPSADDA